MIHSVEIENFRGIQNGKLEGFTPLTLLVGPNGSGKSTLLDALLIGAYPSPVVGLGQASKRRQHIDIREEGRWLFPKASKDAKAKIKIETQQVYLRQSQLRLTGDSVENDYSVVCEVTEKSTPSSNSVIIGKSSIRYSKHHSEQEDVFIHPLPDVLSLTIIDFSPFVYKQPLHELYRQLAEQGHRQQVRELLANLVPDLQDIVFLPVGNNLVPYFDFGTHALPVAVSGDGVYSAFSLILHLASGAGDASLVLLEEPEIHQHPRALGQTAKAVWAAVRRGIQVIISTHSLDLIDALLYEVADGTELEKMSLFRLKLEDGCLLKTHIVGEQIAFARTTIEDDLR